MEGCQGRWRGGGGRPRAPPGVVEPSPSRSSVAMNCAKGSAPAEAGRTTSAGVVAGTGNRSAGAYNGVPEADRGGTGLAGVAGTVIRPVPVSRSSSAATSPGALLTSRAAVTWPPRATAIAAARHTAWLRRGVCSPCSSWWRACASPAPIWSDSHSRAALPRRQTTTAAWPAPACGRPHTANFELDRLRVHRTPIPRPRRSTCCIAPTSLES